MAKRENMLLSAEAEQWLDYIESFMPEGEVTKPGATKVDDPFFGITRDIEIVSSKVDDNQLEAQAKNLTDFINGQKERFKNEGHYLVYGRSEEDMGFFTSLDQFKFGGIK